MTAQSLLDKLDSVKSTGPGRWLAKCPAHADKRPSLSIRELEDGRVLLHDFAGCSAHEVLAAVGLAMSALFPEREVHHSKPVRRPFFPSDVFEVARMEIGIVTVIASDMHENMAINDCDYERLFIACERLNKIARIAYGR